MEKTTIEFTNPDVKKHSVRWDADVVKGEDKPVLSSIYVNKPFATGAKKIRVTIEVVE